MNRRKASKCVVYSLLAIIGLYVMMIGVSNSAFAEGAFEAEPNNPEIALSVDGQICPEYYGLTARFVLCIRGTVSWALERYLADFISYFVTTINVLIALAIMIYGFFVLTGRAQPAGREGVILLIKIGIIGTLIHQAQFTYLFPFLVESIDFMVSLVTEYTAAAQLDSYCPYSPFIWDRVDCVLNMILGGILPGTTISFGLSGFVLAMLFSGGIGFAFFFFGIAIILSVLLSIIQAMFILISAYIALALLSLLAPLMIPLILFKKTKAYFDKWLRMMIGVMLQPIFLFAYLSLFLIALEVSLFTGQYSVYNAITCGASGYTGNLTPNADVYADIPGNDSYSVGRFAFQNGHIQELAGPSALWGMVVSQDVKGFGGRPDGAQGKDGGLQGVIAEKDAGADGSLLFSSDSINVDMSVDGVNIDSIASVCNMDPAEYLWRLVLSLFACVAVLYIFYTMLSFIPYLGTLISSDLFGLPNLANIIPMKSISGQQLMGKLGFNKKGGF